MTMRRTLALAGAATAAAGALVAAGATPEAPASATKTVVLKDISFKPATVSIRRGDSVRWSWRDSPASHNVTFRHSSRHSPTKLKGTYTVRFTRKGTFRYHCTIHPGMDGKVVVR